MCRCLTHLVLLSESIDSFFLLQDGRLHSGKWQKRRRQQGKLKERFRFANTFPLACEPNMLNYIKVIEADVFGSTPNAMVAYFKTENVYQYLKYH